MWVVTSDSALLLPPHLIQIILKICFFMVVFSTSYTAVGAWNFCKLLVSTWLKNLFAKDSHF